MCTLHLTVCTLEAGRVKGNLFLSRVDRENRVYASFYMGYLQYCNTPYPPKNVIGESEGVHPDT